MSIKPFWGNFVLTGAESDEITLTDVEVHPDLLIRTTNRPGEALDELQTSGFLWFELLVTASYLGATSRLVEMALDNPRVPASDTAGPVSYHI